jgi:UDP-glucuronate 4-epimerase
MKVLVTGAAGFIGFHTAKALAGFSEKDCEVIGMDNINAYYDVNLKLGRLLASGIDPEKVDFNKKVKSTLFDNYSFIKMDLCQKEDLQKFFEEEQFDSVIHLAAQAGVRYSLENPTAYADSNFLGFLNILEACRGGRIRHLVFASSSSVYGLNEKAPFAESDPADHPVSLYAASKKANELMAHSYACLFGLPVTGLRFFTVYGPWGRPDMAPFLFTKAVLKGDVIKVFNYGRMQRDFTYVDDVVDGVIKVLKKPPESQAQWDGKSWDPSVSSAPFKIYNIGGGRPVELLEFIKTIEKKLGLEARRELLPLQPGDVPFTWADTSRIERDFDWRPRTDLKTGLSEFIDWYTAFYAPLEDSEGLEAQSTEAVKTWI